MSARSMARRYANALFDVAKQHRRLDDVERDLTSFAMLVTEHPDLQRVFDARTVAPQKKRALLDALLARAGISGEVARLLQMLAERDRLNHVQDVVAALGDRLRQERRVVQAQVVTAQPLSEVERASLQAALRQAAGADVAMSETVNPAIIGGVVARVGSLVFDASVTRQLDRLKQRLTEQA
jgi:F-type H+-transporting ATPase subunit delta